ncbi:MAG: hypothetical protein LBC31_09425 [Treponema sp.]|jgi:hypothetical protein|nr:hypothetical protein [Treponema sp.]
MKPINQNGQAGDPALTGPAREPDSQVPPSPGGFSFETMLDEICERLQDTRYQYSLRRIRKMEEALDDLERELDGFLETSGKE